MDQLGCKRYCCRRMIMTHVDLIEKLLRCVKRGKSMSSVGKCYSLCTVITPLRRTAPRLKYKANRFTSRDFNLSSSSRSFPAKEYTLVTSVPLCSTIETPTIHHCAFPRSEESERSLTMVIHNVYKLDSGSRSQSISTIDHY